MKSKLSENGLIKCIESVCCEYATKELLKSAHKCTPFDTYLRRKKQFTDSLEQQRSKTLKVFFLHSIVIILHFIL